MSILEHAYGLVFFALATWALLVTLTILYLRHRRA